MKQGKGCEGGAVREMAKSLRKHYGADAERASGALEILSGAGAPTEIPLRYAAMKKRPAKRVGAIAK